MRFPAGNVRTTLTLDQTTINNLAFLAEYRGSLSWAIEEAIEFFRPDYQEIKTFYHVPDVRINRAESILNYAREMNEKEPSLFKEKRSRNIKKSIVIDKASLNCITKVAKENQIKRDFLFMSALKHKVDADYKLLKLNLELAKDVLKTLQSMYLELESKFDNCLKTFEKYMAENNVYDSGFYHTYDIEITDNVYNSYEALQKDIKRWEEINSFLEEKNEKYKALLEKDVTKRN